MRRKYVAIRSPRRRWRARPAELSERFCGFEVDDQLEFGGLEDWQVGGLRALEDLTGVDADLTPHLVIIRPIAHQPAGFGLFASGKGCWNPVARRECGELVALANEIRVGGDEQSVDPIAHKAVEGRFDFVLGGSVEDLHLQSKSTRRLARRVTYARRLERSPD